MTKLADSDTKHSHDSPAETAVVSASFKKKKKHIRPKILGHISARWLVAAGIAVVLIVGAGYIFYATRPALKVGNYSLTRREYNKLVGEAKQQGVSKYTARTELAKALAARSAADKLGIKYPTDKSALTRQAVRNGSKNTTSISDYQRFAAYPSLITRYVTLGVKGGYEVAYVNFPFARYIYGFAGEDKGDPKLYRNSDALHSDITYAKQQAEQYRQAYITKKQTIDSIVQSVRTDGRLTYGQASNQSDIFILQQNETKDPLYASGNVVTDALFKEIQKAPVGQPTAILGELWDNDVSLNVPEIKHGDFMDVAYYFIVVKQKVTARPELQTQYDKLLKEYIK